MDESAGRDSINRKIGECLGGPTPAKCLETLFTAEPNGHVAFHLAGVVEATGDLLRARLWYDRASALHESADLSRTAQRARDWINARISRLPDRDASGDEAGHEDLFSWVHYDEDKPEFEEPLYETDEDGEVIEPDGGPVGDDGLTITESEDGKPPWQTPNR